MTIAEEIVALHDGGCMSQAFLLAESGSVRTEQDWLNESTMYHFSDGSAIITTGPFMMQVDSNMKP